MSTTEQSIARAAEALAPWMLEAIRDLVQIESPSEDPAAVNRAATYVSTLAESIGGTPRWHPQTTFGHLLEIQFDYPVDERKPVLLLGHLDTVWPSGTLATMPFEQRDGRLWGPGVLDMKAGVVIALAALRVLREVGCSRPATVLLVSDEEVGSPVSRSVTEHLALGAEAVFVLEPAQGLAYKTSRKGVGHYILRVTGVASHAGVDFERGHSAIRELARLIETVSSFTDLARGRTVNCGRIEGGTRSNVVAAEAYAEVDVRVTTLADADVVEGMFRALRCSDPHCSLEVTGGVNRPPMERSAGTVALFERARASAEKLGYSLGEASTGGGSDGNFTAALGIPTLDGMGAVGEGAHAAHESIMIEHTVPRTALLAAIIAST